MERIVVKDIKNNIYNIDSGLTSNSFVFDCDKLEGKIQINLSGSARANILIINIKDNNEISFDVKEYGYLHF